MAGNFSVFISTPSPRKSHLESSLSSDTYNAFEKTLIGISLSLLSLVTILGNVATIYVYKTTRRLQRPKNYFILSLAAADLLIALVSINLYTMYLIVGYWPLGTVVCYIWLTLDHWALTISNFTLLAIAMDRFVSICYPILHRSLHAKKRYVQHVLLLIWILAFLVWCPTVLLYTEARNNQCFVTVYKQSVTWTVLSAILSYFAPVLLLSVAYSCISYKTTRRCHNIYMVYPKTDDRSSEADNRASKALDNKRPQPCYVTSSTRCRHIKANRRGVEFLFLISLAFIVMWMPYHSMIVILAVKKTSISSHLWNFCYVFGWINSALNPLCYVLGNNQFRKYLLNIVKTYKKKKLLKKRWRDSHSESDSEHDMCHMHKEQPLHQHQQQQKQQQQQKPMEMLQRQKLELDPEDYHEEDKHESLLSTTVTTMVGDDHLD